MDKLTISDYLPISGCRICSIGNRGHHNFGDELILVGLMKLVCRDDGLPRPKLFISGGDLGFLQKFHHYFFESDYLVNVGYIQEIPHGIRSLFRFLFSFGRGKPTSLQNIWNYLSCDAFILGGGELFTEETPGSYLYRFWSLLPYRIRKIFFWNTKLYLMGGFQKPTSRYNRAIARLITICADGCYMRDEESCRDILLVCPGKKHVEWFIDTSYFAVGTQFFASGNNIAFNNNSDFLDMQNNKHYPDMQKHVPTSGGQRSHIIINSNPLSGKRTDELVSIAKDYIHRGYDVYFLPAFYTSNSQQDDMKVYEILSSKISKEIKISKTIGIGDGGPIRLLDRRNRDEFLIIFHSAEKIFCSRLHVFLIAAFLGLDVQAYPYQKKIAKNMSILKRCGILKYSE